MRNVILFFIGLIIITSVTTIHAAEQLPKWKTIAPEGSKVTLTKKNGITEIDYTLKVNEPFQSGHLAYFQSVVRFLFDKPIKLTGNMRRITFEAWGLGSRKRGAEVSYLMPLIQDEKGEILAYTPHPQEHLKSGSEKWSGWMSRDFYSAEAGGATASVFTPLTAGGNCWPDGALTFIGFALVERSKKPATSSRKIMLGEWQAAPLMIKNSNPYVYADSLFNKSGQYTVGSQISTDFQTLPVIEKKEQINYDAGDPTSSKQKISFPLAHADNYWINYLVTDRDHAVITNGKLRAWTEQDMAKATAINPQSPPPTGCLRINPGHAGNGAYTQDENIDVQIRMFPVNNNGYNVRWKIEEFHFPKEIQRGEIKVQAFSTKYLDRNLRVSLPAGVHAARLSMQAIQNGKVLDIKEYIIGRKNGKITPYKGRTGVRTYRDEIKKSSFFRFSYLSYKNNKRMKFDDTEKFVKRFSDTLRRIGQLASNITFNVDLAKFEVLPGVYDFQLLDKVMDAAYDKNCRVSIRLSHANYSDTNLFLWQRYWPQRNYDGSTKMGHSYYGNFSLNSNEHLQNYLRGFETLYKRYCEHPAFQGYYAMEMSGEWAVLDQPWAGTIAGYEKCSIDNFRQWLKRTITTDLTELNSRWGTKFTDWGKVIPPEPTVVDGGKPDLRLWWLDFCHFKLYMENNYWFERTARSIRSYDKGSLLMMYSQDPEGFDDPETYKGIDYLNNGGNHFMRGEGSLVDAWKHGLGWITEPHHPHRWAAYGDKDNRGWLLDWTTYIMLAQAGAGGANLHIYYWPMPGKEDLSLPAHYGREYAYDRYEKFKPILRELHGLELLSAPKEVAVFQDIYTLFCKHRTIYQQRMGDLQRWFELLKNDSVDYEYYRNSNNSKYKLLLPNLLDQVMSAKNIKSIGRDVREGRKAVICATVGRYSPDYPGGEFALLRELGIAPPKETFKATGTAVKANVIQDNPFFKSGDNIDFWSVSDMQKFMHSKDSGKLFWQWPYRWIPQTDYFGYFPAHTLTNGRVLARFDDGGVAVSLHKVGKGEVLVFWGTPDYATSKLGGFMKRVCKWAGVKSQRMGAAVPLTLEGKHQTLNRRYAIMYQDTPGEYKQPLNFVPKGEFFVDELVSGRRLGVYSAAELNSGIKLDWEKGYSPLKILRMIPKKDMQARWEDLYRLPPK